LDREPAQLQRLYLQVDEYVDSDRAAMVAGRIQDALGNSQTAVEFLERVLAYNHRDFEARALLIKNLRQLGRDREADALADVQSRMVAKRQRCRQLRLELVDAPNDTGKLNELAALYWEAESVAEARLVISDILRLKPNDEPAKQLLAQIDAEETSRARNRSTATAAQ
jgi:Flp pilus assembly protein TadD